MEKQWRKLSMFVFIFALIVAACSPAPTATLPPPPTRLPPLPTVQVKNPEAVLRAVTEALNGKDVEAATALLADDVTQTLIPAPEGTGVYKGKEAMHARFQEVVAANPVHTLRSCLTSGDKVTCAATYSDDSTKPLGFDLEFKVEAVVQNGLLKTVIWRMTAASLSKMEAAMDYAQPATMTVSFVGDSCTYDGPKKIPAGEFTVNLDGSRQSDISYGLFIATLEKGRTISDLKPGPGLPQPDWVQEVDKREFMGQVKMHTQAKEGPIYLACFNIDTMMIIGALGPIEIAKEPNRASGRGR